MKQTIYENLKVNGQNLTIEAIVHYSQDSNYGADADGNRGTSVLMLDDVESLHAYDEDGESVELNPKDYSKVVTYLMWNLE